MNTDACGGGLKSLLLPFIHGAEKALFPYWKSSNKVNLKLTDYCTPVSSNKAKKKGSLFVEPLCRYAKNSIQYDYAALAEIISRPRPYHYCFYNMFTPVAVQQFRRQCTMREAEIMLFCQSMMCQSTAPFVHSWLEYDLVVPSPRPLPPSLVSLSVREFHCCKQRAR